MLRKLIMLLVSLLLAAAPGFGFDKDEQAVKDAVERLLQGPVVDAVTRTALPGLYEVVVRDSTIYYMPGTGQFIAGSLFSKDGDNLSRMSLERLAGDRIKSMRILSVQKTHAIKIGSGPIEVIEVSDPDCPYCRKMEEYWKEHQQEVTRYVFLMPLTELHPDAEKKARFILASPDPAKALQNVLSGRLDEDAALLRKTFNDKGRLRIHKEITTKAGIQATPTYLINGTLVSGADTDRIDELIKKGKQAQRDLTI